MDRSDLHSRIGNFSLPCCVSKISRVVNRIKRDRGRGRSGKIEKEEKRKEERRKNKNKRVPLVENDSIIGIGRGGKSSASDFIKA